MMVVENKTIAEVFDTLAKLMEIHGQNPFRAKAMATAAFRISKLPSPIALMNVEEMSKLPGIGNSIASKVAQYLAEGRLPELEELKANTPDGILEMLHIKGLGPKKILVLWKELGLESLGEIFYACNENRLVSLKGFGEKTQEQIRKSISFAFASQGWFRYATVIDEANKVVEQLSSAFRMLNPNVETKIELTGAIRRKNPVLQAIEILVAAEGEDLERAVAMITTISQSIEPNSPLDDTKIPARIYRSENSLPIHIYTTNVEKFGLDLLMTTGSQLHLLKLEELGLHSIAETTLEKSETEIYQELGLNYIEPELREGREEIAKYALDLPEQPLALICYEDLKGCLHNHSTYSDGIHSLREMAEYCKNELGLTYFGISDHSKAAVYANGLSIERVQQQWEEIDRLNQELAPFRIFKGIESDILGDGSLDYPDEILAGFDFVVASIHSNLKMDIDRATQRLIKAIENPYTTILGHPTGRLLLAREGYPIDHKKVIDACAANEVIIEINANPLRLDLDWEWHQYAIEKGVLLAINPDAHRMEGLADMRFGVFAARKGGVSKLHCLNAMELSEIVRLFENKKLSAGATR